MKRAADRQIERTIALLFWLALGAFIAGGMTATGVLLCSK